MIIPKILNEKKIKRPEDYRILTDLAADTGRSVPFRSEAIENWVKIRTGMAARSIGNFNLMDWSVK